jgi:hypothetical protein
MTKRVTMVAEPTPGHEAAEEMVHRAHDSGPLLPEAPAVEAPTPPEKPETPEADQQSPASAPVRDENLKPPDGEQTHAGADAPPSLPPAVTPGGESGHLMTSLELRVHRLEERVAELQETHLSEERLVERIQARLDRSRQTTPTRSPPLATPLALPVAAAHVVEASRFKLASSPAARPTSAAGASRELPQHWLVLDLATELRAMVAMFFDSRYYVTWSTRLVVFGLVPLILLSHFWFPLAWLPLLGSYLDKLLDLALAFLVYKTMSREAHRYREALARGDGQGPVPFR